MPERIASWRGLLAKQETGRGGAAAARRQLAGIGFTISLFIAGQAFPAASDFAAAKIAVFAASLLSAVIGVALLWGAGRAADDGGATPPS